MFAGRRQLPLRHRLLMLVAVALAPVVLLAIVGVVLLGRQDLEQAGRASIERVRAVSSAVDNELSRSIAAASTLTTSQLLARGDFAGFYEDCLRVRAQQPAWITVTLANPDGTYIFNLRQPYGTALPPQDKDLPAIQRVVETGQPVVGNVLKSRLSGETQFTIRVPVNVDGATRYVLSVALKPSSILEVIRRQEIPGDSVVSVLDANQTVVARTRRHDEYSGQLASAGLREIMAKGREAWGENRGTLDGQRTYSAVSRSQWSGWAVAFGQPIDAIAGPLRRSLWILGAGIALSLGVGVVAAILLARTITRPIDGLRAAARALGEGGEPEFSRSGVLELNEVSATLSSTAAALGRSRAEREQLVTRTEEARRYAEESNRAKDEFLAMLGHELRNPLAAISNAVHILDKGGIGKEVAGTAQQVIARQTRHLVRLMDDLLDIGRVNSGKVALERVHVDLRELTARVVGTMQNAAQLTGRKVSLELEQVWVYADASRIEQVITNLVTNAAKYSEAGAPVHVSLVREDTFAVLRVRDSGIGIEPELLPRIFELFVQGARTLDRAQGGLGIGLTLVRRLVELHGGSVGAESPGPGAGSTFTIRLPASDAPGPAADADDVPLCEPCTVLIVEDNEDARATMRVLLEAVYGHTVYEAATGPEGVEAALRLKPQVALIDLGLPGLDGYEVARRIRGAVGPDGMRLVALTGYGATEDYRRSADAGFDLHLVKPVDEPGLARAFAAAPDLAPAEPGRGA